MSEDVEALLDGEAVDEKAEDLADQKTDDTTDDKTEGKSESEKSGTDDKSGEDSPSESDDDKTADKVPLAAVLDERTKRQDAERRAEAYERELAQLRERLKADDPEQQRPDIFENPDKAFEYSEGKINQAVFERITDMSRSIMMDLKPDYEEKEQVFTELANRDPSLVQKMVASPNPAKFAYETATEHLSKQEMGDPEKYREKLEAELREKIKKEMEEEEEKRKASEADKSKADVPSLANASSVTGGFKTPTDKSTTEILDGD